MNILLCSVYHLSKFQGGNEVYLHHLATGLHQNNHQVTYLTSSATNKSRYPYKIIVAPVTHLFGKPLPTLGWGKTIAQFNPDIFHASGSGLPLLSAAGYFKNVKHVPTILTYQAHANPSPPLLRLAAFFEKKLIGESFQGLITTSPHYQENLTRQYPHSSVAFIPLMLSETYLEPLETKLQARRRLQFSARKKYILCVASLSSHHYYKGIEVLMNAAKLLPPNYQVIVIGDGDQQSFYRKKAPSNVQFVGRKPDLKPYYRAADVFVLPSTSDSEGFGLVNLEAMACRTPVITTGIIGPAKWFKKLKVATIIEPNHPRALAQAIKSVIHHPQPTTVNRAFTFARSFSTSTMVNSTIKFYRQFNHET